MTEIVFGGTMRVPVWVRDLKSFHRWTRSEAFPEHGDISFLDGILWLDPGIERDAHNQIKTAIVAVLFQLAQATRAGRIYGDRMRLEHPEAGLSTEPDALFVSRESLLRPRVLIHEGDDSLEIVGSPDMVLEMVSPSSIEKDMVHLPNLCHRAGIREYWLVNPLGEDLDFRIFRHAESGYEAVRARGGWRRSDVFAKSFRLKQGTDEFDLSEFTLEMR